MEVEGLTHVGSKKAPVSNYLDHGKLHPRLGFWVQGLECLQAGMKPFEARLSRREVQDDIRGPRGQVRPWCRPGNGVVLPAPARQEQTSLEDLREDCPSDPETDVPEARHGLCSLCSQICPLLQIPEGQLVQDMLLAAQSPEEMEVRFGSIGDDAARGRVEDVLYIIYKYTSTGTHEAGPPASMFPIYVSIRYMQVPR